jgi:predicted DNA-binding protein
VKEGAGGVVLKRLNVDLEPEMVELLDRLSKSHGLTKSGLVRFLLKQEERRLKGEGD